MYYNNIQIKIYVYILEEIYKDNFQVTSECINFIKPYTIYLDVIFMYVTKIHIIIYI